MYERTRSNCSEDGGTEPRPPRLPQLLHKYSFDGNCCQAPSWSTAPVSARLDRCWIRTSSRPCFLFLFSFFFAAAAAAAQWPCDVWKKTRTWVRKCLAIISPFVCMHESVCMPTRGGEKNDTSACCVHVCAHVNVRKKGALCVCVCVK